MWLQVHLCICVHAPLSPMMQLPPKSQEEIALPSWTSRLRSHHIGWSSSPFFRPADHSEAGIGQWFTVHMSAPCIKRIKQICWQRNIQLHFTFPLSLFVNPSPQSCLAVGQSPDNRLSYWISLDVYLPLPKLFFDPHIRLSQFEPIECYLGSLSSTDLFGMRFWYVMCWWTHPLCWLLVLWISSKIGGTPKK